MGKLQIRFPGQNMPECSPQLLRRHPNVLIVGRQKGLDNAMALELPKENMTAIKSSFSCSTRNQHHGTCAHDNSTTRRMHGASNSNGRSCKHPYPKLYTSKTAQRTEGSQHENCAHTQSGQHEEFTTQEQNKNNNDNTHKKQRKHTPHS